MLRRLRFPLAILAAVFVALQLVPHGRDHTNPPVVADAPWPSAEARRLAVAACYDCHSHETRWPPYSWVAPFSWLVTRDVDQGRDDLNFSRWDEDGDRADKAAEEMEDGTMPPRRYELAHPGARLSAAERQQLIDALTAMEGGDRGNGRRGSNSSRR
ncbi:MAG: heme-binding domain-containing protein [Acidimicrobiia bacterium]